MKKLLAVALVVVMVLSLAACGGADYVGSWVIDKDSVKEAVIKMAQEQLGEDIDLENELYASVIDAQLEQFDGCTLEVTSKDATMNMNGEGSTKEYEKTDKGFKVVDDGQSLEFVFDSAKDTLSCSFGGIDLTFKRK